MAYQIEWEQNGVVRRFHGTVAGSDIVNAQYHLFADKRFDGMRYVINDCTGILTTNVGPQDIDFGVAMEEGPVQTNPHILLAFVTVDEIVLKHAALVATSSPYRVAAFPVMQAARDWIASVPLADYRKRH